MNQEELVRRLQIKDIMAFERLYNMYWKNICGVVNTIVRDNSLAQEISQDVFAKVWHNAHNYSPSKGRFFSWILSMARNAAIDAVGTKSDQNNEKHLSADYFLDILKGNTGVTQLRDITGLKKLAKNVEKKNIEIFDLLYFKGYSHRETSEELGIPLNKLKKRNRRCIFQIRENMTFEWI